jgi:hypothetical protein
VQLGLLPRSKRVGEKGKHRGSRGIYPVEVIRRIDEIRRAMNEGETLEALAKATDGVKGRLSAARTLMAEVLEAALSGLEGVALDRTTKARVKSEIALFDKQARMWIRGMESVAETLHPTNKATVLAKPVAKLRGARAALKRSRRPGGV